MTSPGPPRLALQLLRILVRGEAREFIEGDLREEHHARAATHGPTAAAKWFWRQTLSTILTASPLEGRPQTSRAAAPDPIV